MLTKWVKKKQLIKNHKLTISTYYRILIDLNPLTDYCKHVEKLIDHEVRIIKRLEKL